MRGKTRTKLWQRLLSVSLAAMLLLETSGSALAYWAGDREEGPTAVTYTDKEGKAQTADESWAEAFPYGAFAFEQSGLALKEGESGVIRVYRLGGTTGRATAYLTYEPVLVRGEGGKAIYDYAVSAHDVAIRVEEPLPQAQYDPVGLPPPPETGKAAVTAEPDELGYTLRLSAEAQSYQWQILTGGSWTDILDATQAQIPADAEFIDSDSLDYRCLYTLDGVEYCSRSLRGVVYHQPEPELLPARPEGLELNTDPVYSPLNLLGEGEKPFNGWAFELIFADGEWVKEIHLDALPDQLAEAQETAAFTIRDCYGGQVLESANTLLFRIEDTNEPEPSTLGFTVDAITADKADGTVTAMIRRVGGDQRPVSVEYATADGTAAAGRDYASASGKLMFYAGVTSLPVKVKLIDDGVPSDEPLTFRIVLSQLLGDDSCTLTQSEVEVELTRSAPEGAETAPSDELPNLPTQLYEPDAVDVSGTVTESSTVANAGGQAATGMQVPLRQPEPVYAELTSPGADGELSLQVYDGKLWNLDFRNPEQPWTDSVDLASPDYWTVSKNSGVLRTGLYGPGSTINEAGFANSKDHNDYMDLSITKGVALASDTSTRAEVREDAWQKLHTNSRIAGQMFGSYKADFQANMSHDVAYAIKYFSWTEPRLFFSQGTRDLIAAPRQVQRFGANAINKYWVIKASDDGSNFYNPYSTSFSGNLNYSGVLSLEMDMSYAGSHPREQETLVGVSVAWLKEMTLNRRTFAPGAFFAEISTPNDANTAPDGCVKLTESNYGDFKPQVEIVPGEGGVNSSGQLYVGSRIKIHAAAAPKGYVPSNVVVYQSRDNGASWNRFDKFGTGSYNAGDKTYTFTLVGGSQHLTPEDLNAQYKFRVCYNRKSSITVDFTPSVPRKDGSATELDIGRRNEVLTGYSGTSDHGFTTGVSPDITYGCSAFNSGVGDFDSTLSAPTQIAKPRDLPLTPGNEVQWTFEGYNIQWVCFNLSPRDLLLINGKAYAGDDRIYLREADLTGNLSVVYYHEDYQSAQSPMKTAIAWTAVYFDANGNGRIDGHYNESNSTFTLEPGTDEFVCYLDPGSFNETRFAPRKNEEGKYCQYFIKVCYTMIPRSLVQPQGSGSDERAQILPAFVTAINPDSEAYSKLTPEQRAYSYLVSGKTRQSSTAPDSRSSDGHLKYGAAASARTTLDIPLGGDFSPATLPEGGDSYTWNPVFRGNMLFPHAAPAPITIENSVAGPTPVTGDYRIRRDEEGVITGYEYGDVGLARMNGYLSSFTGTTTFALVTQEQLHTTEELLNHARPGVQLGGGAGSIGDGSIYVQSAEEWQVRPDSVTLSGCSTTPDAEYLKQMQGSAPPSSDVDMDQSGSEMSEFNIDMGINLGSMELAVTDAVTIITDENQIGFAVGLPLGATGDETSNFMDANRDSWTQFGDFFKKGNFMGDESYANASREYSRVHPSPAASPAASQVPPASQRPSNTPRPTASQGPAPSHSQGPAPSGQPTPAPSGQPSPCDNTQFKSKSFSVDFAVGLAFLFEYNSLDNGYYFEGMTVSFSASLSFRIQARLTVCPVVYFYFQLDAGIELATGLGVIREAVEADTPILNAKTAATNGQRVNLTYMARPSSGMVITQKAYNALTPAQKSLYEAATVEGYYYLSTLDTFEKARSVYLETGDYFLTKDQYGVLTGEEKQNYEWGTSGGKGAYFNKTRYGSCRDAMAAYDKATTYSFETQQKSFNIRFSGRLSLDVYTMQDGQWKPAPESEKFGSGFLSSDGKGDTTVTLQKRDGMTLDQKVKVVLRPLDHDAEATLDQTTISYIAEVRAIRNEVYWKGISISPSVGIEIGAGVGVELLKLELYAKVGLEASFLLGVYNPDYDPYDDSAANDQQYEPASVDSFGFSIGLGLRVVLVLFTFEMDAVTYCVDYDGSEWTTGWHFLNDLVGQGTADDGFQGVSIRLPAATDQQLYTSQDNAEAEVGTLAYDPTDPSVPFQLSGFAQSVDAANLSSTMLPGSDYKVVRAGDRDFIVYTVSRPGTAGEDVSQLVMSELTRLNTAPEGETPVYKYGLANPAGGDGPLYLVLDPDNTGDLDFDIWAETEGNTHTVHGAWVSYAAPGATEPQKPDGEPFSGMNADNWDDPTLAPAAPVPSAYYTTESISTDAYDALTPEQQTLCRQNEAGRWIRYTLAEGYTTVEEATAALADARIRYGQDQTTYTAWHDYYQSLASYHAYLQQRLKNAAQNTVLKSASWSYTVTPAADGEEASVRNDAAFSAAVLLDGDPRSSKGYLFAPASGGDGSVVFYGSTVASDENDAAYRQFTDFLSDHKMGGSNYNYLRGTKKSTLDVLGTRSALNLAVNGTTHFMALGEGQTLGSVKFTRLKGDDAWYLAYTTRQDAYTEDDHITVGRLFLRKVTIDPAGDVTWGEPYLLRMTRDYDLTDSRDGLYDTADRQTKAHTSPYFSNLSFLTARLDSSMLTGEEESFTTQAVEEHTFLLFEMNGATYIILDDSLRSITGSGRGTIHPFFTGPVSTDPDTGEQVQQASGKLEVTIGTDSLGNLFAVYVSGVPNTTNNALWLSPYDAETNTWGDGILLAMHSMDTYEAAVRSSWGKRTAQAAYLGLSGTGDGLLTEEDVQHLFGSHADDILTNLRANPNALGDRKNLTFSNIQALRGSGDDLLVLTQGSLTELRVESYVRDGKTDYTVMPVYGEQGMESSLGMYAVSYGRGKQNLGDGTISFGSPDFSVGSRLYVNLSAVNTGDTAFRGSPDQPITATLTGGGQELAAWLITGNIRSGQTLSLSGDCLPLNHDLQTGETFTLTLKEFEGAGYLDPVTTSVELLEVRQLPDLGVEDLSVTTAGVSPDGLTTTLNVDFVAANRGSGMAEGVYAQFTYADGTDAAGDPTYAVLPLTGSNLTVDQARELKTLAADENGDANLSQGILYIYNADDGSNDLKAGYGRRVHGTIRVPSAAFTAGQAGALSMKIELFTGSDRITGMDAGAISASHDEYYAADNAAVIRIQAATRYTVAPSVVIPMGATTLIPVTAVSSRGTRPALSVTEIDDTSDGLNIGILNFRQSSAQGGSVTGMLSVTPSRTGSGVIHLYDADTECQTAVAFIVTEAADGIDIFQDNGTFSFFNADGSAFDPDAPAATQTWAFSSIPGSWGEGTSAELPLRGNLSLGKTGSFFRFRTVAESIDLHFQGEIAVSSPDFPGYTGSTHTNASGGSVPTTISFGPNPENTPHTIEVRVTNDVTRFDRLVEHYSGGVIPKPEYDGTNPLLIWSRSTPDTASITSGSIPLSLYLLDNNGLDYLSINGVRYQADSAAVTRLDGDDLLWRYDFGEITANGSYDITVADVSGNTVSTVFIADWFHDPASGDPDTVEVPRYQADFFLGDAPLGTGVVGKDDVGRLNLSFTEEDGNRKPDNNAHQVYYFDGSTFNELTADAADPARFPVSANGFYWARTVNTDGTWTAQVLPIDRVDGTLPQVAATLDSTDSRLLNWSAFKTGKTAAPITDVTVNGFPVNRSQGTNLYGTLKLAFNGDYAVAAVDSGLNRGSTTAHSTALRLDLSSCTTGSTASWDQARSTGIVTADLSRATGAFYSAEDSDEARNEYLGRFEATTVPADYDLTGLTSDAGLVWKPVNLAGRFQYRCEKLAPGDWLIAVRDAADHNNTATLPVTVADHAIVASADGQNATLNTSADGRIVAAAAGGSTPHFEFAVHAAPDHQPEDSKTPTLADFLALDTPESEDDNIVWQLADAPAADSRTSTFDGLRPGQYLVAIRGLYGVSDDLMAAAVRTGDALRKALDALDAAKDPTPEEKARLEAAVAEAQADYDAAAGAVRTASAEAYTHTAGYWDGAAVTTAQVGYDGKKPGSGNLSRPQTDSSGVTVFPIKNMEKPLARSDSRKITEANRNGDLLLKGEGLSVFVPAETLTAGFDVNRLLVSPAQAQSGMVIRYTGPAGRTYIVPWCLMEDGSVRYLALEQGRYELVPAEADFRDIDGLWGAGDIDFTARRELFNGTGDRMFSPDLPMSRAMFVTVLWRMAGSPSVEAEQSFTDLTQDWYLQAVQWAAANGIAGGYGEGRFGPDDPVNREQMCAFLCRFLTWLGREPDTTAESFRFADADQISPWAAENVDFCARAGLIRGVGENRFAPSQNASRMEVSALLSRFVTKLVEKYCGM